jgi:hypothetical protein
MPPPVKQVAVTPRSSTPVQAQTVQMPGSFASATWTPPAEATHYGVMVAPKSLFEDGPAFTAAWPRLYQAARDQAHESCGEPCTVVGTFLIAGNFPAMRPVAYEDADAVGVAVFVAPLTEAFGGAVKDIR